VRSALALMRAASGASAGGGGGGTPPTLAGTGSNYGTTASLPVTLATATATGDVVVVFATNYWANPAPVTGVTGLGATWTRLEGGTLGTMECWIGVNPTAGQTVVTIAYGGGGGQAVGYVCKWSGASATPAAHISASGTGTQKPTTGTMTSTAAKQVAVGTWYCENTSEFGGTAADLPSAWTSDHATVSFGNSSINLPAHFVTTAAAQSLEHKRSGNNTSGYGWAGAAVLLDPA